MFRCFSNRSSFFLRAVPHTLTLVLLTAPGCGRAVSDRVSVHPVEGQITLDGKPLAHAFVVLHPRDSTATRAVPARAETDEQGRFELSTYDARDGAAPGEYSVTVQYHKLVKHGDSVTAGPNVLSAKLATPTTTDIVVRVAEGPNRLAPIEVRR